MPSKPGSMPRIRRAISCRRRAGSRRLVLPAGAWTCPGRHRRREGDEIGVHYDPMIAKLIVRGEDRELPRLRRLGRALAETRVAGVVTNLDLLGAIVRPSGLRRGRRRHRLHRAAQGRAHSRRDGAAGRGAGNGGVDGAARASRDCGGRRRSRTRSALALARGRWLAPQRRCPAWPSFSLPRRRERARRYRAFPRAWVSARLAGWLDNSGSGPRRGRSPFEPVSTAAGSPPTRRKAATASPCSARIGPGA